MGEKYRFFDSIDGEDERFYTADEFAEYFRQFIRNGIFSGGENLKVSTDEKDMKINIKPGYAWIEGYLYKIAGEDLVLEHNISDPSLNRIDRVVIRLDKTLENRYVKAFILEGTPELAPKVPELTRNDNTYEVSLAKVEIIAGKSFIEAYQITDERLDNMVCGLTTHLFEQIDTTVIFDEWQNYLIHKRNESNLSYDQFVAAYQNIWNSWIEDKISEPSGEFYAEWKAWFDEVQDTTNLVTKTQFDGFKDTRGMANGLATLDEYGKLYMEQLKAGEENGVAPLDEEGQIPESVLKKVPYVWNFITDYWLDFTTKTIDISNIPPYNQYKIFGIFYTAQSYVNHGVNVTPFFNGINYLCQGGNGAYFPAGATAFNPYANSQVNYMQMPCNGWDQLFEIDLFKVESVNKWIIGGNTRGANGVSMSGGSFVTSSGYNLDRIRFTWNGSEVSFRAGSCVTILGRD